MNELLDIGVLLPRMNEYTTWPASFVGLLSFGSSFLPVGLCFMFVPVRFFLK